MRNARLFVLAGLLTLVTLAGGSAAAEPESVADTMIVVVRHAEKALPDATGDAKDPSLSAPGQQRAQALANALGDSAVGAIYATGFKRTQQTAAPLAQRSGVPITTYDANSPATEFVAGVLREQRGKSVLIVGHSNTVPEIVAALSGKTVAPIADGEYTRLYVILVDAQGSARLLNAGFPQLAATH